MTMCDDVTKVPVTIFLSQFYYTMVFKFFMIIHVRTICHIFFRYCQKHIQVYTNFKPAYRYRYLFLYILFVMMVCAGVSWLGQKSTGIPSLPLHGQQWVRNNRLHFLDETQCSGAALHFLAPVTALSLNFENFLNKSNLYRYRYPYRHPGTSLLGTQKYIILGL